MSLKGKTLTKKVKEALGFVYDDERVSPICTYENLQKILPFLKEAEAEILERDLRLEKIRTLFNEQPKWSVLKDNPQVMFDWLHKIEELVWEK